MSEQPTRTANTANTSLAFGIIAIVPALFVMRPTIGLLLALLALIPAIIAVTLGHKGRRNPIGRRAATWGLLLGYPALILVVLRITVWPLLA